MDMYWIYDIPSLELGLGIKAIFLFVSLTALMATRGIIAKHFYKSHEADQAVSAIFGAVGMLYGLLLGLVAVAAWQNYDKLNDLVDEEASAIIQLYRCVNVLKDPSHEPILEGIKTYTKDIIEVSWPAHKHGMAPMTGIDLITALHKKLANYESKAKNQPTSYGEAVSAFSDMVKARRMRVNGVDIGIPSALWLVIIGGAVLTIPITFFFHLPSLKTHLLLTGFYVVFLAGMIALIAVLDNPIRGEISISTEPYQKALKAMERIDADNQTLSNDLK
jgi:hypothetical protein